MQEVETGKRKAVTAPTRHYYRYLILTTMRRSGAPVPTPVWFVAQGEKIYIYTKASTGKVKRIRHTARVLLTPSDSQGNPKGLTVVGQARLLPQFEASPFDRALSEKYGLMRSLFRLFEDVTGSNEGVFIEVTPDPGPGTNDLLLTSIPEPQLRRERAVNAGIIAGVITALLGIVALLRVRRARRAGIAD